ncbi:MAG: hypothetical protein KGL39_39760 [Patescibacteria group bacterium]|nr:hypothetical protein [Patescibacteria group bacterium]
MKGQFLQINLNSLISLGGTLLIAALGFLGKSAFEDIKRDISGLKDYERSQDARINKIESENANTREWRSDASSRLSDLRHDVNDNRSSIVGLSTRVAHIEDRDGITASDNISLYTNSAVKVK